MTICTLSIIQRFPTSTMWFSVKTSTIVRYCQVLRRLSIVSIFCTSINYRIHGCRGRSP
jgi:hypothetical protein